ncbi:Calcium-binding EF-hand [Salix suchowensis]|nr:Calcium-binding EF-hand [Salix suchowensis]
MGQVLDKFHGKQWREKQIRLITDKAYNRIKSLSGSANLSFEELYIAVLLVYNDINKRLPGPHFDPPSKEQVRAMMQACDMNLDGELDHEEFVKFMKQLTSDAFIVVSQGLIITLVVAPTVAMATKKATEGVPGVGKVLAISHLASLPRLILLEPSFGFGLSNKNDQDCKERIKTSSDYCVQLTLQDGNKGTVLKELYKIVKICNLLRKKMPP